MKATELIQNDIPPVRINETIEKALNWMDEFKLNHIPVVNKTDMWVYFLTIWFMIIIN